VLASYPLLAAPAAVGVLAALWHLITARTFDTLGVVLGICMVAVLVMRELLVVRDIRRYAGQLQTARRISVAGGRRDRPHPGARRAAAITWQSPAASRLFGLTDDEVVGRAFRDRSTPTTSPPAQAVIDSCSPASTPTARRAGQRPSADGDDLWRETESTISDQRAVPEVAPWWCTCATSASASISSGRCTSCPTPTSSPGWPTAGR
jgi:hypothetical protein